MKGLTLKIMNVDVNRSRSNAIVDLASCKVKKELKNYSAKVLILSNDGQGKSGSMFSDNLDRFYGTRKNLNSDIIMMN